ncbi:MAG TPA: nucleotidyltransferase family protein [Candidatus Methylomirabilis sp.]|nr:nucleotidyltransferase family protein [Candidatus Methylomirabilis sp.]
MSAEAIRDLVPRATLARFCQRWRITELALFGSVLRPDFRPDSDIDLLVTFAPDATWSGWDLVTIEADLAQLFGRKVDLVERAAVEGSENWIRRRHILTHAEPLYVEG